MDETVSRSAFPILCEQAMPIDEDACELLEFLPKPLGGVVEVM